MKTNKLAAGALALALGLGAVAPSYAATKDEVNKAVSTLTDTQKETITRLNAELEELKAELPKLEADLAAAEKLEAEKAAELEKAKQSVPKVAELTAKIERLAKDIKTAESELAGDEAKEDTPEKTVKDDEAVKALTNEKKEAQKELDEIYQPKLDRAVKVATQNLIQAQQTVINAKAQLRKQQEAVNAKIVEIKGEIDNISAYLNPEDLNKLLALVNNDVVKEVEVPEAPAKPEESEESKEDVLAKAEKAYEDARVTVKAVELIKVTAPKVYENNKVAIDAYLEKANAAINKLGKVLGKKVAVSDLLFSTAYADEEASLEEIKDLTKEVEDVDKEGKELLENINKQEEEADKEEDNKDKPADDKKDNEEKPADDEKDEKEDDKKADDKKDEKKPAAKKASSNAKTGVAGVTGVAGILAAASVAYAASKKRD